MIALARSPSTSRRETAIAALAELAAAEGHPVLLRVAVDGGGCSGFQHKLDLDPNFNEKLDQLFEFDGVGLVVDKRSLLYLQGASVDFHDDLNKSGFSVTNPTAKSTCGCGKSFS